MIGVITAKLEKGCSTYFNGQYLGMTFYYILSYVRPGQHSSIRLSVVVRAAVIPAVTVPSVNSPIFFGVSGIIVGSCRRNFFFHPKLIFGPISAHFRGQQGAKMARNGRLGGIFVPAVRVRHVNSPIFFGVTGIIVGSSRSKKICFAQN
jgi:hypothetical protein